MRSVSPFREGVKAAIPVWIAFIPVSFALGMAAKAYGLHLWEIVLMSALVYAGPAQFAALEPLASGKPALQVLLTTFLINLRFLVMSAALAPYFRRVRRTTLLLCSQLLSASSFVLPYTHFQKEAQSSSSSQRGEESGGRNLGYFVGVGVTCLLTIELRERTALLIGVASALAAVPGAVLNPTWGWLGTALVIGTVGWGVERWIRRGSR